MSSDLEREIKEQEERLAKLREDRKRQEKASHRLVKRGKERDRVLRKIHDTLADELRGLTINWRSYKVKQKSETDLTAQAQEIIDVAVALAEEVRVDFDDFRERILGGTE
jgi:signal transduction histidine kinase